METLPKRAPATTLADVVERVARACHVELRQLVERCAGADARARAAELARYAHRARQRLVRCAIVEQWSRKSAKIATVATNAHLTLRAHEEAFVQNLHAHNRRGIVLSWSNNEGGNGHVNLRTVEWVAARFGALGYDHDAAATKALRDAVKDIAWLRDTILVLRRRAP